MNTSSAFHLDCNGVIPECGFKCDRCIQETQAVFARTPGVSRFYRRGDGVVVEHDPDVISVGQLMEVFGTLPSFYSGFFVPTLVGP
jgi:hypothetical protein